MYFAPKARERAVLAAFRAAWAAFNRVLLETTLATIHITANATPPPSSGTAPDG
jgi:hypothetical protein